MNVAVVPWYSELLGDRIFEFDGYDARKLYGPDRAGFAALRDRMESGGHAMATVDRFEEGEIDVCVFVDVNYYYLHRFLSRPPEDRPKLVYIAREPPTTVPFNAAASLRRYLPAFDRVLTWNDDLVADHDRVYRYSLPYCVASERVSDHPSFDARTLLVNVTSRKYSDHPNELYSARESVVRYFDDEHPDEFDLYGRGWNQRPSPMELYGGHVVFPRKYGCYRGLADDKVETFSRYRFALAFENVTDVPGYVTEKLFDCFRAGVVPVYWGADNVEEFVPRDAFIDYRDFLSPADLRDHLASMSEDEHREYVAAAREFLDTDDRFTPDRYAERVTELLTSLPEDTEDPPDHLVEDLKPRAHLERLEYDPRAVPPGEYVVRTLRLLGSNPELLARNPKPFYFGLRRLVTDGDVRHSRFKRVHAREVEE